MAGRRQVKPETENTRVDAWATVGRVLSRREPDFPIAGEVAQRLADHYEARLPIGWESVPIVAEPPSPQDIGGGPC